MKDNDIISREAAIDIAMNDSLILNAMDSVKDDDIHRTKRAIVRLLASLPSAQKKGKWIRLDDEKCYWYECSECGHLPPKDTFKQEWLSDFCPNCGADMRGEKDGCFNQQTGCD